MNSYFASVEQQANPLLRGKSVGVCATKTVKGCIIASSVEAKRKGVRTGCRIEDAIMLDPSIVLVENDSNKYRTVTKHIFGILSEYTDFIEAYSIDEAFLDLTGFVASLQEGQRLGVHIQQRIKDEVGEWLQCSVGVAPTRWLAKFAGDTTNKGDVLVLDRRMLPRYYEQFSLTDAWGINVRLERRLRALGIYTLNELRTTPPDRLTRALGRTGYYLWANVNGLELDGVQPRSEPKSIGHSHVLTARWERDAPRKVLMKLCEKTGRRLRERRLQAYGISVWWSFVNGGGFHTSFRVQRPVYDTADIFRTTVPLLEKTSWDKEILSVAVTAFALTPRVYQLSFFDDPVARDMLTHAVDAINNRYGEYVVYRGSMWQTEHYAPDRIGFRKTVSWEPHTTHDVTYDTHH